MREIKFRGQCVQSGEWVYGDLIHGVGHKSGNIYILPNRINLAGIKHCDPLDGVKILPETIGQYTGENDDKGNEIYGKELVFIGTNDFGNISPYPFEVIVQGCDFVLKRVDLDLIWGRLSRVRELNWKINIVSSVIPKISEP